METCKHNLHARVIWPKGSTPLIVLALRKKLSEIWKDLSLWGVMSLGKGFYEFSFSCLEDVKRVRSIASWNLNPGILKLFTWTKDFSPNVQNSSLAQVWLRIYGLSQEYWRPKILFSIACSVGTPICTDVATTKPMVERTFRHFSRVLVDVDLSQDLRYKVLVERKNYAFFVNFEYENLPNYSIHCNKIGHYIDVCIFANKLDGNTDADKTKKTNKETRKEYVPIRDGRAKQGRNDANPIVINGNNERNMSAPPVNKGKSPIKDQHTDITCNNKEVENYIPKKSNRFDALLLVDKEHNDDIRVTMKNADIQLEDELNKELQENQLNANDQSGRSEDEDHSSKCSEFVEASNMDIFEEHADRNEVNSGKSVDPTLALANLQELERNNKAFLDQSWANIVENDEAEQRLLNDLEK